MNNVLFFTLPPYKGPITVKHSSYRDLFPQQQRGWSIKLITHLHLVLRLRKCGAIPSLPSYLFMVKFLI